MIGKIWGALCAMAVTVSAATGAMAQKVDFAGSVTWYGQVPIMLAVDKGYFKDQGLDVTYQVILASGDRLASVTAGSTAFSNLGRPAVIAAMARGDTSFYFFANIDDSPGNEGCWARPGFTSFKDLKGKKVTYPSASSQHLAHLYALRRAGMAAADIEVVPLAPPQGLAAVINGDVEAGWFWDPFVSQAVEKGATRIINNKELGAYDPFGFAMTTKFLSEAKHVAGVGRMLRAMAEGQRRFASEPGPTMEKIKSITGIETALAQQIIKGVEWYTVPGQMDANHPLSMADPANLGKGAGQVLKDRVEELALAGQMITKRGNITEFLDNRALKLALVP